VDRTVTVLMINSYPDYIDANDWSAALRTRISTLDFRLWPDAGDPTEIDIALIDKGAEPGFFDEMTGLKAVVYLGAGVDGIDLGSFPRNIPLIRLYSRNQTSEVVQYIVLRVLCRHRHVAEYMDHQAKRIWKPIAPKKISETSIVILGAGRIGGWAARVFYEFGYDTAVWSRSPKELTGVTVYSGRQQFADALAGRDYVVCTLPLTPETRSLLNAQTFGAMKRGAYLVNVGRGAQIDEADLICALNEGQLSGACLDVFSHEPLDPASPLWSYPNVTITPHVASFWVGMEQIAEVCEQVTMGTPLANRIDLSRGY
jgi:glyoxylate/hydroxypyruvate reductase